MNSLRKFTIALAIAALTAQAAVIPDFRFRRLDTRDGLSNAQVNCIMRDQKGFVWLATPYGLNRYDGYRLRQFYSYEQDTTTLNSNRVDNVMEAHDGRLWMKQGMYYSVLDPTTERVDRNPSLWLNKQGMKGSIEQMFIDSKKNYWVKTIDDGYAILNPNTKQVRTINYGYGPEEFPKEFGVSDFSESKQGTIVVSTQGELICIDGDKGKIKWKDSYVKKQLDFYTDFGVYVDPADNYWVIPNTKELFVYSQRQKRWYNTLPELMRDKGFSNVPDEIIVWDVCYDKNGLLWVATDHLGVLVLNFKSLEWKQFTYVKGDETTIPDITNKHLYLDQLGRMWVATYKNGVAMCSEVMSDNFINLAVGDINAICEDKEGYYWIGSNNGGISKMDPKTHEILEEYNKENLGLRSDIIVSAYTANDGSLWFGTYDGGLIVNDHGKWKNYLASDPGSALSTNNIWGVCEDKWGYMWIGVLGGGVVRMDRRTGKQRVFNQDNSELITIWTNSIQRAPNGWILVGNSDYFSMIHPGNYTIINGKLSASANTTSITAASNQAVMDTRGLIWLASSSGVTIYDPKTHQTTLLNMRSGMLGSNTVAVAEDKQRTMWVVTDHGVSNILPRKRQVDGVWTFNIRSYSERDGLQPGPYNQRAICCTKNGTLLIGGQEGVDIINTNDLDHTTGDEKPVFSGLQVFNEEVTVGQPVDGHVILTKPLNLCSKLSLKYSENQFTIEMGSDNGGVKNATRFVYRLLGFNERWIRTSENNPNISYMSLPSGSYTLCVRMLNDDGSMGAVESQLEIVIASPWYRSWWAVLIYLLLAAAALWWLSQRYSVTRKERPAAGDAGTAEANSYDSTPSATDEERAPAEEEEVIEEAVLMDDDEVTEV